MAPRDLTEATRARVLDLYAAYARHDMAAVMAGLAEDIDWQSLGDHCAPWSGRWSGKSGVGAYFAALGGTCEVTAYDIEHVIADGDRACVLATLRVRFRADGTEHAYAKVDVLRLAGGQVAEFREFYDTARMLAELGQVNTASSDRATP